MINRETWRKALQWNKLPKWRNIPQAQRREIGFFAWGVVVGVIGMSIPWQRIIMGTASLVEQVQERHQERDGLSPMLHQAWREDLGYDQIRKDVKAYKGHYVRWCIDHPARGVAYLAGKPAEPIIFENPDDVPINSPTSGGRCNDMLASVVGHKPDGLVLRFIGLP